MNPASLRVLVVEDDAMNQAMAERILRILGFSPDFAGNGAEAIALVRAAAYDVILMDLQMPVLDGFAATGAIRAWEKEQSGGRRPAWIVAFTANMAAADRNRCAEVGMDDFIGKPTTLERMREVFAAIAADRLVGSQEGEAWGRNEEGRITAC